MLSKFDLPTIYLSYFSMNGRHCFYLEDTLRDDVLIIRLSGTVNTSHTVRAVEKPPH